MPLDSFGVGLAGRAFRGGHLGECKPRVVVEQVYEALADHAGGAEDANTESASSQRNGGHTTPPSCAGPIRVPRARGLNVLRTQTTISASAASGRTLA